MQVGTPDMDPETNVSGLEAAESFFSQSLAEEDSGPSPDEERTPSEVEDDRDEPAPSDDEDEADAEEPDEEEEEDSDEPGDDESDEPEEGEEDEGEDAEDDEGEEPHYKVVVHGEEIEVPLSELLAGYSRQADYTRKTQELAEQRKAFETERQQVAQERQAYAQLLTQLQAQLENAGEPEPDWDTLYNEDPVRYMLEKQRWQEKQEKLRAVKEEQARLQKQQEAELQRMLEEKVAEERRLLLEKVPEWASDDKLASREKDGIIRYATEIGFTPEELSQLYDHRSLLVLRDAYRYRAMKQAESLKQQPARKKSRPAGERADEGVKPVRPGRADKRVRRHTELTKKKQRLAKTHRVRDAASVFEEQLLQEERAARKNRR